MTNLITTLKAVKIEGLKIKVAKGYVLLEGWTVINTVTGKYFSTDGEFPYLPAGGKRAAQDVAAGGVFETATFLEAAA